MSFFVWFQDKAGKKSSLLDHRCCFLWFWLFQCNLTGNIKWKPEMCNMKIKSTSFISLSIHNTNALWKAVIDNKEKKPNALIVLFSLFIYMIRLNLLFYINNRSTNSNTCFWTSYENAFQKHYSNLNGWGWSKW